MTNTDEARIEISTLCNYNCVICPLNNGGFNREKTIMSTSLFTTILNKLKEEAPYIKNITVSGMGEPIIDKDYVKKLEIAKNLGYKTYLLSNGSRFSEKDIDYLISNNILDSIRFSLHTLNKEHYEKITGSNDIETPIKNIEIFLSKKEYYNSDISLIISADIVEEYSQDAAELISTYSDRVDLLEIWRPHNWVDWSSYRQGEKKKQTCGRPFNGPLQIQVDGTVNMCCFDFGGVLLLGDFKTQTLEEIFQSDMYKRIVDFHRGGEDENLICNKCDQLFEKNSSIMIYNSKFDIEKRINETSTTYDEL